MPQEVPAGDAVSQASPGQLASCARPMGSSASTQDILAGTTGPMQLQPREAQMPRCRQGKSRDRFWVLLLREGQAWQDRGSVWARPLGWGYRPIQRLPGSEVIFPSPPSGGGAQSLDGSYTQALGVPCTLLGLGGWDSRAGQGLHEGGWECGDTQTCQTWTWLLWSSGSSAPSEGSEEMTAQLSPWDPPPPFPEQEPQAAPGLVTLPFPGRPGPHFSQLSALSQILTLRCC